MRRRPPTLGATGLDFGAKPAISFVLPRKKIPAPEDDECPPSNAPTTLEIKVSMSGTVTTGEACEGAEVDISLSETDDTFTLADYWSPAFSTCGAEIGVGSPELSYACPGGCAEYISNQADIDITIRKGGDGHWYLAPTFIVPLVASFYCGGENIIDFEGFEVDIGTNPLGTHTITQTASGRTVTWVVILS